MVFALLSDTKANLLVAGAILLVCMAIFTWWVVFVKRKNRNQEGDN